MMVTITPPIINRSCCWIHDRGNGLRLEREGGSSLFELFNESPRKDVPANSDSNPVGAVPKRPGFRVKASSSNSDKLACGVQSISSPGVFVVDALETRDGAPNVGTSGFGVEAIKDSDGIRDERGLTGAFFTAVLLCLERIIGGGSTTFNVIIANRPNATSTAKKEPYVPSVTFDPHNDTNTDIESRESQMTNCIRIDSLRPVRRLDKPRL